METTHYIIIASILVVILLFLLIIKIQKKPKKKTILIEDIATAFGKENILKLDFVRNKLNVTVKDFKKADMNALKEAGATGINIVGDKIKLYFEEDNESIYQALKQALEVHHLDLFFPQLAQAMKDFDLKKPDEYTERFDSDELSLDESGLQLLAKHVRITVGEVLEMCVISNTATAP